MKKQRIRHGKLNARRDLVLWALMIPAIVFLIIFRYKPYLGLQIAFKNYRVTKDMWECDWIGLQNFVKLFKTSVFSTVISNTVVLSLLKILFGFPAPIIIALMLTVPHSCVHGAPSLRFHG